MRMGTIESAGAATACALLVIACLSSPSRAGRWIGSVEAGYDTYTERYSIADEDTLSSIDEMRTRLRLGWASGYIGRNYGLIEARQYLGQSNWESPLHGLMTRRFGHGTPWVLSLDGEASRRGFQPGSGYEYPNDYTRIYARAGVRGPVSSRVELRVDDRVEYLDYEHRTEFDYDFTRNIATAMLDFGRDPFRGISAGVRYSKMAIPDSSEIAYDAIGPVLEMRSFGDPHERLYVMVNADRRLYPDDGTRSSFWSILASAVFERPVAQHWSVELSTDIDNYNYDVSTGAYDDYLETRNYVAVNWFNEGFKVGAGPGFGWLSSRSIAEEEYRELGARLAVEQIGVSGLYVSAVYEVGRRDYSTYSSGASLVENTAAIFSDYIYNRVNVFANVRIYRSLWLNGLLDWQPEDHDRDGDDATATVGSVSLTWFL